MLHIKQSYSYVIETETNVKSTTIMIALVPIYSG